MHLDLRGLSPPEPMVGVLREIDGGADGPLIVHMDRDPIFLYQELADRGWSASPRQGGEQDSVILELTRDAAS